MSKRTQELEKIFKDLDENVQAIVRPLLTDMAFIEEQLAILRKYPFIKKHPKDPTIQKQTAAGKLYKELLAQEKDIVRILCAQLRKQDASEESPLRLYLKELEKRK